MRGPRRCGPAGAGPRDLLTDPQTRFTVQNRSDSVRLMRTCRSVPELREVQRFGKSEGRLQRRPREQPAVFQQLRREVHDRELITSKHRNEHKMRAGNRRPSLVSGQIARARTTVPLVAAAAAAAASTAAATTIAIAARVLLALP